MCDKLREVKEWLRAGAPGRALEAAEVAGVSLKGTDAERMCREVEKVIHDFDKERGADPGCDCVPISASDRELLACKILNSLFGTNL